MIPILFASTATTFTTNGIGRLADAISCTITEERNGIYELTMKYPISGLHYADLAEEKILYAQPRPGGSNQAFRIYRISRPLNGVVTVDARHISYQLNKVVVMPFTAGSCAAALTGLKTNSVGSCPFDFSTDKSVTATFTVTSPASLRSLLGGTSGSILDVFGTGEYEWDNYTVKLWLHRGSDNGVTIRYGKNLTELRNDSSTGNVYTGIVPYYASGDTVVTLPEGALWGDHTTDYSQLMAVPVDLTSEFSADTVPTEAQLRSAGQTYLANSTAWKLSNNITVSFVDLADTEEYKNVAVLQRVNLCDTVTVTDPDLGVSVKSKVIKVTYNVLTERYDSIELGDAETNLAESIIHAAGIGTTVPTTSAMQQAIDHATELITGGLGGHIVIKKNADGEPEEILIMDTDDTSTAVNVWRWNLNGLGHSSTGYNGPFTDIAITQDGQIVANYITSGTLTANIIRAGLLRSVINQDTYWDLDTGVFHLSSADAEQIAEYVDASGLILSMPYTINGFVVSFRAQLVTGSSDVTENYLSTCYSWWKRENNEITYLGNGYNFSFDLQDFNYGGSIILQFEAMEYQGMLDADDNVLVDASSDTLVCYAPPTTEPIVSCETDFTDGAAVAALELTAQQLLSRMNEYNGTNVTMESAISQTAHSIAMTVSGTAGQQTAAGIEISLLDADGNVIDSADGDIYITGNVVFKSNLTDGTTTISGDNITTGIIKDANDNVVFDLANGTLDINDGSIDLGDGAFVVTSEGTATMNSGYIGNVECTGSISGGAIYQTVDTSEASGGGYSPTIISQASITEGIGSFGAVSINGVKMVGEGADDAGGYSGILTQGHFSTYGCVWAGQSEADAWRINSRGNIIGMRIRYYYDIQPVSDRNHKKDITELTEEQATEFIYALKPVFFRFKREGDNNRRHHGFIAQDVEEIAENWDVVDTNEDPDDPTKTFKSLNYTEIIADLVKTVQSQNKRIEALETQIKELLNDGK